LVADILAACAKDTGARVIYDAEPAPLVDALLKLHRETSWGGAPAGNALEDRRPGVADDTETDPVCGMRVAPQTAAAERIIAGRRFVFCSPTCANVFDTGSGGFRAPNALRARDAPRPDHGTESGRSG
jgi:YHS domain-containing protein